MNNQSPKFLALQKRWYAKLAKEGFKDCEDSRGELKELHSTKIIKNYTPAMYNNKKEYYDRAYKFYHDNKFSCQKDRFIWHKHMNGVGVRAISLGLKQHKITMAKTQVHEKIVQLELIMKKLYDEQE